MATIAVFIALGGGAYAVTIAPRNSVKSRSIVNGAVKSADLQNRGVQPGDLAISALGSRAYGRVAGNDGSVVGGKNINDVQHDAASSTYCFDLTFVPHAGVAGLSPAEGVVKLGNAQVQIPGGPAGASCEPPFADAAVVTDLDSTGTVGDEASFEVIFD